MKKKIFLVLVFMLAFDTAPRANQIYVCERPIRGTPDLRYVPRAREYVFSIRECRGSRPKPIVRAFFAENSRALSKPEKQEFKKFIIHFKYADANLSEETKQTLRQIAKEASKAKRISIRGCTCWVSKIKGGNERIARKRAESVAEFLISQGIPKGKLEIRWSAHCPYIDLQNPEPNRRAEVEIWD